MSSLVATRNGLGDGHRRGGEDLVIVDSFRPILVYRRVQTVAVRRFASECIHWKIGALHTMDSESP